MASSSTNSSEKSDDQTDKLDQTSQSSDQKQQDDLSPNLIEKKSCVCLAAHPVRKRGVIYDESFKERDGPSARPFEEVAIDPPNDGTSKPGDGNSSSTK